MTKKSNPAIRQPRLWPKTMRDHFYAKFVFSDGYIVEQKPAKILAFISKWIKRESKKTASQIVEVLESTKDLNDLDSIIYAIEDQYIKKHKHK